MRFLWLALVALAAAGCSSDESGSPRGGAGAGGGATLDGGAGMGGGAGTGGNAPLDAGHDAADAASTNPDGGGHDGDAALGDASAVTDFGQLAGARFLARGSNVGFFQVSGRGYASFSIFEWGETCSEQVVCGAGQINFTLYAIGGTLDDIGPGTYAVRSAADAGVRHEIAGAAGRYDGACTTGGGFPRIESGTLTITSIAGGRARGAIAFTLENGDAIAGDFDALDCSGRDR